MYIIYMHKFSVFKTKFKQIKTLLTQCKIYDKTVYICTCMQTYVTLRCIKIDFNLDWLSIIFLFLKSEPKMGGGEKKRTVEKSLLFLIYSRVKNYYNIASFPGSGGGSFRGDVALQYTAPNPFPNSSSLKNWVFFCYTNWTISPLQNIGVYNV